MNDNKVWAEDSVKVARKVDLEEQLTGPGKTGRSDVFDFSGEGGSETWLGWVRLPALLNTGPHHHGRHEVSIFVVKGAGRIRWGSELEFAADIHPGDFVYFTPFVPHWEENLSDSEPLELVAIRSDRERIAIPMDIKPVDEPKMID